MFISSYRNGIQATLDVLQQAVDQVNKDAAELERKSALDMPPIAKVESVSAAMRDLKSPGEYDPNRKYLNGSYEYRMLIKAIVAAARLHLEQCWLKAQEIHVQNEAALTSNKILTERLSLQMRQLGFPEDYTEWVFATPRASKKTEKKEIAGWRRDLSRSVRTSDSFAEAERDYKSRAADIDRFEREWLVKEQSAARAKEKAQAEKTRALQVALLAHKYGLDGTQATARDVLDKIMARDRYLALAHGLYMNRQDWSEGLYYGKAAVNSFPMGNELDAEISTYLSDLIAAKYEQGDMDGRVFRDCEWNYDRLFGMVDPALKADYDALCQGMEWV